MNVIVSSGHRSQIFDHELVVAAGMVDIVHEGSKEEGSDAHVALEVVDAGRVLQEVVATLEDYDTGKRPTGSV